MAFPFFLFWKQKTKNNGSSHAAAITNLPKPSSMVHRHHTMASFLFTTANFHLNLNA